MDSIFNTKSGMESVTAYINSGGRGTRLNKTFSPDPDYGIAKGLLEVGDPPLKLVDHHINRLSSVAFRNIVIGAGDLKVVSDYIRDKYIDDDEIECIDTSEYQQLGTAGDLLVALRRSPALFGEHILINNVDTILDLNSRQFALPHLARHALLSIALTTQSGVPNQNAFVVSEDNKVLFNAESANNVRTRKEAEERSQYIASSTGALIIEKTFLESIVWQPKDGQLSLYRDIMSAALRQDSVAAYNNGQNFFVDVGTDITWKQYARSPELQAQLWYDNEEIESEGSL